MDHVVLLLPLMERMVLVWFAAYLFSQTNLFWNIVKSRTTYKDHISFILIFSLISIMGTYLGIKLEDGAIANIRPLGAIVSGLIGGPVLGGMVGLIAGLHRWYLGGITGFACGVATVFEGLVGGFIALKFKRSFLDIRVAFLAGVLGEICQIFFVLLLTRPIEKAIAIEMVVGIPMIVVNTVGVVGFIIVVRDVFQKHNGMIISQFNRFVEIERTISIVTEKGMDSESADAILEELTKRTELKGILLGKGDGILSYRGSKNELEKLVTLRDFTEFNAPEKLQFKFGRANALYYCVPLKNNNKINPLWFGVKLSGKSYYDHYIIQFTDGLAELTENQLAASQAKDIQTKMTLAQLKALKAQIQPHFLFNALSTISSLCRTDSMKARELILDLAQYFRKTIDEESDVVSLESEMEAVKSYLRIEEARLGNRLKVIYEIPPELSQIQIPTFFIQPLVENAIKHGISHLTEPGEVQIKASLQGGFLSIYIANTKPPHYEACPGCGQAIKNIRSRLEYLYGEKGVFLLDLRPKNEVIACIQMPVEV